MRQVLDDPVAKYVWLAMILAGVVVGWITVEPWWAVGLFACGYAAAIALAAARRRSPR